MTYVVMFTTTDFDTGRVHLDKEVYDDFEEAMQSFTLLSASRDNVVMIEPESKKVICHYKSEGKTTFNRYLLDSSLYFDNRE